MCVNSLCQPHTLVGVFLFWFVFVWHFFLLCFLLISDCIKTLRAMLPLRAQTTPPQLSKPQRCGERAYCRLKRLCRPGRGHHPAACHHQPPPRVQKCSQQLRCSAPAHVPAQSQAQLLSSLVGVTVSSLTCIRNRITCLAVDQDSEVSSVSTLSRIKCWVLWL